MSAEDRVRWDKIYRQRQADPFPDPDPILYEYTPPAPEAVRSRALDLAAGLGQNGLWLAAQGYQVDLVEISRVALKRARAEMTMRNLRNLNLLQMDLDDLILDREVYDVACVFRYLKREVIPKLGDSVIPGGRVIYQTFNLRYLELVPEFNRAFLLDPGELRGFFPGWQIIHHSEDDHISQLVGRKPE
jgi:SAM-dependent methyltransferase